VSIQAQILNLLVDLQRELALTYLIISHNLPVVNFMADKIGVLFLGRLVECGDARIVLSEALHPYTRSLLDNVLDPGARRSRAGPRGLEQAGAADWSSGCAFRTRCPIADPLCAREHPKERVVAGVRVACHMASTVLASAVEAAREQQFAAS
jgi:peptide/nickel transport system ATP-binding protein